MYKISIHKTTVPKRKKKKKRRKRKKVESVENSRSIHFTKKKLLSD